MRIPSPRDIYREIKGKKEQKLAAVEMFEERLTYALAKKNLGEREQLTKALKEQGIEAKDLHVLTETAKDVRFFLITERAKANKYGAKTFADIEGRVPFIKLVLVLRKLYAEDIADKISHEDAFKIIVEKFLAPTAGIQ